MDLFIAGKGSVRLEQSDFVGQGGQGRVYARGDTAYKIYTDPAGMIPVAKIKELSVLTHSNIIRPEEVLLDAQNRAVGYTMRRVQDAHPLCRLFTRAFRERRGITGVQILALIQEFQETVQHIHDQGVLVVDMHEMNFLIDRDFQRILFIDVDSYKTPGFPATVIADSIRDRHAADFSVETDWFAFAIVTFQMFIGVHPYRGKHPDYTDMDARMRANISALNPAVTIPASCYPLDSLPASYRDWYAAVLDQGLRVPPPKGARLVPTVTPRILHIPAGIRLKIREIARFTGTLSADDTDKNTIHGLHRFPQRQQWPMPVVLQVVDASTVLTNQGVFIRSVLKLGAGNFHPGVPACGSSASSADKVLAVTPRLRRLVLAELEQRKLRLWDAFEARELPCSLHADNLMTYADRLYIKQGTAIYEVRWLELPMGLQPMLHPVANVLPHSTRLLEGVAVQELPGAWYVSVFPDAGICQTLRIPEMEGQRILDARFDQNVLMLASEQAGKYTISILRFGDACQNYDLRTVPDAASPDLNFVTLDNGVCLWLNPREELEIFSNQKGATSLKLLNEPALHGVRLFKEGTQALFAREDTLYEMTMGA